ncbi:hypothetical protein BASA83_007578 [Batrachochytrium salamandrivorans]|nr:hypothetical protein BASA83_007578 [Batrachochytrium salamandrivorans]
MFVPEDTTKCLRRHKLLKHASLQSGAQHPLNFIRYSETSSLSMPIIVQEMPSGGLFFHGELIQRKLAVKSRRHVMLCLPTTTDDISLIQAELAMQAAISKHTAVLSAEEAVEQRMRQDMEAYGHIALSAVSGYPLLVIGTNVRTFIHFSQIDALLDETELQTPCAFAVVTAFKEFKFYTNTSTDYQRWIGALTQAFANLNFNVKDDSYRPVSPESFNEAFQRHTPMAPSTLFSDYTEPEPRQSISRLSRADTPARSLDMEPIAWDSRHSGNVESINNSEQPSERAISTKSSRLFTKIKSLFKSESTKDSSQPHYYQTRYPESDENGHSRPRTWVDPKDHDHDLEVSLDFYWSCTFSSARRFWPFLFKDGLTGHIKSTLESTFAPAGPNIDRR